MRGAKNPGKSLLLLWALFFSLGFAGDGSPLAPAGGRGEAIPWEWAGVEKVVAVGDLHGDYEHFVKILKAVGVVNGDLGWAAGKTHLVQTGDVMDRGPEARRICELLMRLEGEAEAAGGKVHVLIGNHEELNITGMVFNYPDFMTLDQFISFLPETYRRRAEKDLQNKINKLRSAGDLTPADQVVNDFWAVLRNDPQGQRRYVLGFNEKFGAWYLKKNVAIKINDTVFIHGGLSEKYAAWGLEEINNRYRLELKDLKRAIESETMPKIAQQLLVYKGDGPLWYRELATVPEAEIADELDRTLALLGASHMVIAHTPTVAATAESMKRFGGKVWIVDTGISRVFKGHLSALIIQNGEFLVWGGEYEDESSRGLVSAGYGPRFERSFEAGPSGR